MGCNSTHESGKLLSYRFRKNANPNRRRAPLLEEHTSPTTLSPDPATAPTQARDLEDSTEAHGQAVSWTCR